MQARSSTCRSPYVCDAPAPPNTSSRVSCRSQECVAVSSACRSRSAPSGPRPPKSTRRFATSVPVWLYRGDGGVPLHRTSDHWLASTSRTYVSLWYVPPVSPYRCPPKTGALTPHVGPLVGVDVRC